MLPMNIADKQALFTEMHRVLRPGGKLALHDVMAGPVQPVHFPVPWAPDPSMSFLAEPEESRALILATGFEELAWQDQTQLTGGLVEKCPRTRFREAALPPEPEPRHRVAIS